MTNDNRPVPSPPLPSLPVASEYCAFDHAVVTRMPIILGCIDNGPKMAKIKIEVCYFT